MQRLYDDKFVDTVGTIRLAQTHNLPMREVGDRLDVCKMEQDKLWEWRAWVLDSIRGKEPEFLDYEDLVTQLRSLGAYSLVLSEEFDKALEELPVSSAAMRRWVTIAEGSLAKAKADVRESLKALDLVGLPEVPPTLVREEVRDFVKQGRFRAEKVQYDDGVGCCLWMVRPELPEDTGICFDFAEGDLDDLIGVLQLLKKAPITKLSTGTQGES